MPLKFDAMLPAQPLRRAADIGRRAAAAGLSGLVVTEAGRTAYLSCGAIATAAEIDVLTGIAVAFPRSPMVTAATAWELAEASGGRFRLGLGSQVRAHMERRYGAALPNVEAGAARRRAPGGGPRDHRACLPGGGRHRERAGDVARAGAAAGGVLRVDAQLRVHLRAARPGGHDRPPARTTGRATWQGWRRRSTTTSWRTSSPRARGTTSPTPSWRSTAASRTRVVSYFTGTDVVQNPDTFERWGKLAGKVIGAS